MRYYTIFLMLIISSQIKGQDIVKILGKVNDYFSEELLIGVSIIAIDSSRQKTNIGTITISDGTFELIVPRHINELEVCHRGYQTNIFKIDHSNDPGKRITLSLVNDFLVKHMPNYEELSSKIDTSLKNNHLSGTWQVTYFELNDFVRNEVANILEHNKGASQPDYKAYNFYVYFEAYERLNGNLGIIKYENGPNAYNGWAYVILEENRISIEGPKDRWVTAERHYTYRTPISFKRLMKYFSSKTNVTIIGNDRIHMKLNGAFLRMKKIK